MLGLFVVISSVYNGGDCLTGQRDELEEHDSIPRTKSDDLSSDENHVMSVTKAAKLKEMDEEIASLSTREPLYSTDSEDGMCYPPQVELTYSDDSLTRLSREVVHSAINRAVALCEFVDSILKEAIQHVQRDKRENYCDEDTLKSLPANMTCEERYAAFKSDSSSSSISTQDHNVDKPDNTHAQSEHNTSSMERKDALLHLDSSSSGGDTPTSDYVEIRKDFRLVKITPLVHSGSLEDDNTATPIIELNQTPTHTDNLSQCAEEKQQSDTEQQKDGLNVEENHNIEVKHDAEGKQFIEDEQIKDAENVNEQNDTTESTGIDKLAEEKVDSLGELLEVNGEVKINVVPSMRHDDGSLSPEPSFSKLLVSSKSGKKDGTLDGKIFGILHSPMHQSDSLPSFTSHGKLVDPDSISLVINQCNEDDLEHSDEDILIAHAMGSTSFIDEFLDSASLDSTNFSQESRDNLVFPNSPVALRHNKESIVRRRYDAGRFDETSPVKEEEKNGFAEFAELFETTFQTSRRQRERSSSPHTNKVTSVFVFEGSHDDDGGKVRKPVGDTRTIVLA